MKKLTFTFTHKDGQKLIVTAGMFTTVLGFLNDCRAVRWTQLQSILVELN